MRIGSRDITPDAPPYVIAEVGVNHNGSVRTALDLVHAARDAGADAVKLQWFDPDLLLSRHARPAQYQARAGATDPLHMLRSLQLTPDQIGTLAAAAHDVGLHAIVTIFSDALVPLARHMPFDAFKVASPDIIHKPLLDALLSTGTPIICSTGAATIDEVRCALAWLGSAHDRLALLQCVSAYPTPPHNASLAAIAHLASLFPGPVGYSDHTTDTDTGALAVACGARILEKHLTLDRSAPGPDHAASLQPDDFARYVALARAAPAQTPDPADPRLGPPHKRLLPCEHDVRTVSRQSLTTTETLHAGHRLRRQDLTCKRPGTGLPPFMLNDVIGRTLSRTVPRDTPLTPQDLA